MKTVGIVGVGNIGSGIAELCALRGYPVRIRDSSDESTIRARSAISEKLARRVAKGALSQAQATDALAAITIVQSVAELSDCDIAIEAVTEDEGIKRSVFEELCSSLKADAMIGSNSSTIAITRLASMTDRPERFIGMHFMHPVAAMELVELIPGMATHGETVAAASAFVASLDKSAVCAADFPAFIVNRVLMAAINEAIYVLYEGVGSVDGIDTAMRLGAHHPMGPLQLADFIGLDTCLSIIQTLHTGLSDTKYRPCPLLVKYVDAGWLGRKSQRGFYDYRGSMPVPTR